MSLQSRQLGSIETLEQRQLMAGDTLGAVTPDVEPSAMIFVKIPPMGDSSVQTASYDDGSTAADTFRFSVEREMKESGEKGGTADINIGVGELQECTISKSMDPASTAFGVEREMKESGEKAGTEDINIGVGELQECTVSKSMDMCSMDLAQAAINGNSPGTAEIDFVEVAGGGDAAAEYEATDGAFEELASEPIPYLKYKLDRCFVKSWSISGDADDRPTEEVAFYYNKIGFSYAATVNGQEW